MWNVYYISEGGVIHKYVFFCDVFVCDKTLISQSQGAYQTVIYVLRPNLKGNMNAVVLSHTPTKIKIYCKTVWKEISKDLWLQHHW